MSGFSASCQTSATDGEPDPETLNQGESKRALKVHKVSVKDSTVSIKDSAIEVYKVGQVLGSNLYNILGLPEGKIRGLPEGCDCEGLEFRDIGSATRVRVSLPR